MGKPVIHWEFWSLDPARVSDFYSSVFDWKIQDMPEINYRIVDTGGFSDPDGRVLGIWKRAESR